MSNIQQAVFCWADHGTVSSTLVLVLSTLHDFFFFFNLDYYLNERNTESYIFVKDTRYMPKNHKNRRYCLTIYCCYYLLFIYYNLLAGQKSALAFFSILY